MNVEFDGNSYVQVDGVAMGSIESPLPFPM